MMQMLNFYCDETYPMEHDKQPFFILGCVYLAREEAATAAKKIIQIKRKYGYGPDYEVKWTNINGKNVSMIREIIGYAFSNSHIHIRVVIDDNKDGKRFSLNGTHEQIYAAIYRALIKKPLERSLYENITGAHLYFDVRNTQSDKNGKKLCRSLASSLPNIKIHSTIVDSEQVQLIQIIDLFIGACSYEERGLETNVHKLEILNVIRKLSGRKRISASTPASQRKFNVFRWGRIYE